MGPVTVSEDLKGIDVGEDESIAFGDGSINVVFFQAPDRGAEVAAWQDDRCSVGGGRPVFVPGSQIPARGWAWGRGNVLSYEGKPFKLTERIVEVDRCVRGCCTRTLMRAQPIQVPL